MRLAHLYVFSDACPTDWLTDGREEDCHTITNFVLQSDPALQSQIENGKIHEEVLAHDQQCGGLIADVEAELPGRRLRKWSTGPGYRLGFCRAFAAVVSKHRPIVSALSFQEKPLRASKTAVLNSYNKLLGGMEGRGIGFEESRDERDRQRVKHAFVCFRGYQEIEGLENQILVLLLMSWFIADQYVFYRGEIVDGGRYGFEALGITVVSDRLSGDDDVRRKSEQSHP
jgi:hypothetical protein